MYDVILYFDDGTSRPIRHAWGRLAWDDAVGMMLYLYQDLGGAKYTGGGVYPIAWELVRVP